MGYWCASKNDFNMHHTRLHFGFSVLIGIGLHISLVFQLCFIFWTKKKKKKIKSNKILAAYVRKQSPLEVEHSLMASPCLVCYTMQ